MNKSNKQLLYGICIVFLLAFALLYFKGGVKPLAIDIGSEESRLKQEYTTLWADNVDGMISTAICKVVDTDQDGFTVMDKDGNRANINEFIGALHLSYEECVQKLPAINTQFPTLCRDYNKDKIKFPVCYKSSRYGYQYYENEMFIASSQNQELPKTFSNRIDFSTGRTSSAGIRFKQKFKGQEIATIVGGSYVNGDTFNFGEVDYPYDCVTITGGIKCQGEEGVKVIYKPHTLEPTKWDVIRNGETIKELTADSSGFLTLSGSAVRTSGQIYYIGYKAQFSCDLSPNERWIETQWQGSVSINDVISKDGFTPTKYCKETRPFVLRDLQQGETSIYPGPIPDFNRGKTISSPSSNQLITIRYAVYQVPGLENPTTGTQAYVCDQRDSNYKCLKWSIKEVIKPLEIVVQCKVDDDCPLPLTKFQNNECLGYFKGCQENRCIYDNTILEAPKCQNQVVTIVKQIQEVDRRTFTPVTGINVFTFSQNKDRNGFSIGNTPFSASTPQFICTSPLDTINAPNPSSNCWKTSVNFGSKSFEMKDSASVLIHPYIKVQYFASGDWVLNSEFKQANDKTSFRNDNWGNTFIFTVDTAEALNLDIEDSGFVIKDSIKRININLINNLPAGEILIKFQQKIKTTNQNLPEQSISRNINEGSNSFSIDLNTQNLGLNAVTVQIFYKITADTEVLIPSDKFILN